MQWVKKNENFKAVGIETCTNAFCNLVGLNKLEGCLVAEYIVVFAFIHQAISIPTSLLST